MKKKFSVSYIFKYFFILVVGLISGCNSQLIWSRYSPPDNHIADTQITPNNHADSSNNLIQSQSFENLQFQERKVDFAQFSVRDIQYFTSSQGDALLFVVLEQAYMICNLSGYCTQPIVFAYIPEQLAFCPKKSLLALSKKNQIEIYTVLENRLLSSQSEIKETVTSLAFNESCEDLLVGTISGSIYNWFFNATESKLVFSDLTRYNGHSVIVDRLLTHYTNRVFFSLDWNGILSAWMLYEAEPFTYSDRDNPFDPAFWSDVSQRARVQLPAQVTDVKQSQDGKYLLLSLKGNLILVWSIRGFKEFCRMPFEAGDIQELAISEDSNHIAVLTKAKKLFFAELDLSEIPEKNQCSFEFKEIPRKDSIQDIIKYDKDFIRVFNGQSFIRINAGEL